jgi:tRNA threonylcarbamoyladenosine biosynthesis protein TsaB
MIILTIRTDKPEAEIGLFDDNSQVAYETWQAHRLLAETLHTKLDALLKDRHKAFKDIEAIVAYQGPGSFTGLRIGLSVVNALAASYGIPAVGSAGDDWIQVAIDKLLRGDVRPSVVLPEYGGEIFITPPRR